MHQRVCQRDASESPGRVTAEKGGRRKDRRDQVLRGRQCELGRSSELISGLSEADGGPAWQERACLCGWEEGGLCSDNSGRPKRRVGEEPITLQTHTCPSA